MKIIVEKLDELKIDLILGELSKPGYYLPESRTLFISNKLDENGIKEVVLHELKHIMDHEDYIVLYNKSFNIRSKLEYEANDFMISELINEGEGYFDYAGVLSKYNFNMGFEDALKQKII